MGCDIHGWVEYNWGANWEPMLNAESVLSRNYDTFGLLFGVRNYVNFKSIAPERGIPKDVSDFVKKDSLDGDSHSHSFITLEEYNAIDWETESQEYDGRIHMYDKVKGEWKSSRKASMAGSIDVNSVLSTGKKELIKGDTKYVVEKTKAKDCLGWHFEEMFKYLNKIQKEYDYYKIRLVVWFDN